MGRGAIDSIDPTDLHFLRLHLRCVWSLELKYRKTDTPINIEPQEGVTLKIIKCHTPKQNVKSNFLTLENNLFINDMHNILSSKHKITAIFFSTPDLGPDMKTVLSNANTRH